MRLIPKMIWRRNSKAAQRASWLAVFAIVLQAVLPAIHDAAGMAVAAPPGLASGQHLCLSPGSTTPDDPGKTPSHHISPCALCSAMHAVGGFVPPTVPVIAVRNDPDVIGPAPVFVFLPGQWPNTKQQPRAPPFLV